MALLPGPDAEDPWWTEELTKSFGNVKPEFLHTDTTYRKSDGTLLLLNLDIVRKGLERSFVNLNRVSQNIHRLKVKQLDKDGKTGKGYKTWRGMQDILFFGFQNLQFFLQVLLQKILQFFSSGFENSTVFAPPQGGYCAGGL